MFTMRGLNDSNEHAHVNIGSKRSKLSPQIMTIKRVNSELSWFYFSDSQLTYLKFSFNRAEGLKGNSTQSFSDTVSLFGKLT